ncbi:MAG: serine hydrolase [Candidatus Sumerlaeaceae bacterium]|nr:serine hydrolase [Candidatus Sumerlaeaceae bacterium]
MSASANEAPQQFPTLRYAMPSQVGMDDALGSRIDRVVENSLSKRETSGAVVLVLRRGAIVHEKAYGWRAVVPSKEEMTTDTIFDLASLTKCVATASAVMKLVEMGELRLGDAVKKYIPEWTNTPEEKARLAAYDKLNRFIRQRVLRVQPMLEATQDNSTSATELARSLKENPLQLWRQLWRNGELKLSEKFWDDVVAKSTVDREAVTLRHLLTHTSGLDAYDNYHVKFPQGDARKAMINDIARRPLRAPAGEKFIYSDLGYITLGEIVERVSGMDLNHFCRKYLYEPLGMRDTMFNPPKELLARIAPSEWRIPTSKASDALVREKYMIRGEVHDGNAFVQNGISGHAGLFSTAHDLAIFAQMLLQGGAYGNTRIFGPLTVRAMTSPQVNLPDGTRRGYGWDVSSDYSHQRGDIFASGFGHTGWTGTSLWAVPEENLAIIILTNRCHPDGSGNVSALRAKIANVVAASILVSDASIRLPEESPK